VDWDKAKRRGGGACSTRAPHNYHGIERSENYHRFEWSDFEGCPRPTLLGAAPVAARGLTAGEV
jgi:hypothetical protein